jgi:hypothetical protein
LAVAIAKSVGSYHEENLPVDIAMPLYRKTSIFLSQAIARQFGKGIDDIVDLEKTAILLGIATVFG